jgi:hypothetical protein
MWYFLRSSLSSTSKRSDAKSIAMQKTNEADKNDPVESCIASSVRFMKEDVAYLDRVPVEAYHDECEEIDRDEACLERVCCEHL